MELAKVYPFKSGEEKILKLILRPDAFSTVSSDGERQILPGEFEVTVGGGQPLPGIKTLTSSINVILK